MKVDSNYSHLNFETRQTLDWSIEARMKYNWEDVWIPYKAADRILGNLKRMINRPRSLRPLNALILGPSGNGKSSLLGRLLDSYPPEKVDAPGLPEGALVLGASGNGKSSLLNQLGIENPRFGVPWGWITPVVPVITPANANERSILSGLLHGLKAPYSKHDTTGDLYDRLVNGLDACQTRIVTVDELHNMMRGGKRADESLRVLKNISSILGIPMIYAGTEDALRVLRYDRQLASRVTIFRLPLWENNEELEYLLRMREGSISLRKASRLWKEPKRSRIFKFSQVFDSDPEPKSGILDNILKLVKLSSDEALLDGSEEITIAHLNKVAEEYGWHEAHEEPDEV